MDIESFREVLFYLASMAVIVIAAAILIGVYVVFRLVRRVEDLMRSVRGEVEMLKAKRKNIEVSGRTGLRLLKMAALFFLRRRLF